VGAAIVTANCRVQPVSFYRIGVAAAEGAPKASEQIIPAITAAIPALKPVIARAQADLKKENRTASLAWVLKHAENVLLAMSRETKTTPEALLAQESESTMTAKVASLSSTIVQGPPFVPGGGTPGEVPVSGTTETSYTNRIYSAP
jgi:hypothetical protein